MLRLASLLHQWAQRINLTGHRSLDAIARRLLLESAAIAAQLPPLASLADIGSGAGFPGLPIATLRPQCQVTLLEARKKRHHFQRAAIRELRLANVASVLGRSDQLEPRPHTAAIGQALARPERAVEWLLPWVEKGGLVLVPGGPREPAIGERSDVLFETCSHYRVPCGGPERTLWIGRRSA